MNILLLAAAIASISVTITQSSVFKPLRDFLRLSVLKCTYCFSHWLAFIAALLIASNAKEWFIYSFALVTIASIFSLFIIKLLKEIDHE